MPTRLQGAWCAATVDPASLGIDESPEFELSERARDPAPFHTSRDQVAGDRSVTTKDQLGQSEAADREAQLVMRARDFWGIARSDCWPCPCSFFGKPLFIPLVGRKPRRCQRVGDWYNSAAIVPLLGIFGAAMLILSLVSARAIPSASGGARNGRWRLPGSGGTRSKLFRTSTIGRDLAGSMWLVWFLRVDFILCSGLLITALTYGYSWRTCAARVGGLAPCVGWPQQALYCA